jgi:beta-galactosidase GanA
MMDGKQFRLIGGTFHYFRVPQPFWEETLKKMANAGLNSVETFVAWNGHEPRKGEFVFDGDFDLEKFIKLCEQYKLYMVLRAGPYMCGERDHGGLPWWILKETLKLRTTDPIYMGHVKTWMTKLYGILKPHLYINGGNIILVQLENEYGCFACDKAYMPGIHAIAREVLGPDVLLTTVDPGGAQKCGNLVPQALETVDFSCHANAKGELDKTHATNKNKGPRCVMEYWPGWFHEWGVHGATKDDSQCVADQLEKLYNLNANINMYMFVGGTNWGFINGAYMQGSYRACTTTYDFVAPISEGGDMTRKYELVKEVIKKHRPDPLPEYPVSNRTKKDYGTVTFTEGITFWDALPHLQVKVEDADLPISFEMLDIPYGFVLYQAQTPIDTPGDINFSHIHDRAYVFSDRELQCIGRRHGLTKPCPVKAGKMEILVENMGRIVYGPHMFEYKGIEGVKVGEKEIKRWANVGLSFDEVTKLPFKQGVPATTPAFLRGHFEITGEPADTHLCPTGWKKGDAWVNGHFLGRYWHIGPQGTLWIPSIFLKTGQNEVIIFEQEGMEAKHSLTLVAKANLVVPITPDE